MLQFQPSKVKKILKIQRENQNIHRKVRVLASIVTAKILKGVHIATSIIAMTIQKEVTKVQIATPNEMLRGEKDKAAGNILTSFPTVKQTVLRRTKAGHINHPPIAPKQSRRLQNIRVTRRAVGMGIGSEEEERLRMQIRSSLF
mmetsp:Transcript_12887/g.19434  ORF Transcript_12887/g.19434 Transcript_12887/m.19434 type:complete len:144 (+) Transcript_12887:1615-2046(+)